MSTLVSKGSRDEELVSAAGTAPWLWAERECGRSQLLACSCDTSLPQHNLFPLCNGNNTSSYLLGHLRAILICKDARKEFR